MELTDSERRALDAGRVTVVRPMEDQRQTLEVVAPATPGDTLPDYPGSRVVSVEAMRLHDSQNVYGKRKGRHSGFQRALERSWDRINGHRPDWRYEANPWCWVVEVERDPA